MPGLRLLAVLAVTLATAAGLAGPLAPPAAAASDRAVAMENDFMRRINALRADRGLPPLAMHAELNSVARRWSAGMADRGRLEHNPNLSREVRADWTRLRENVGYGSSVPRIWDAFVASASHYRNLVDASVTYAGVGVVEDDGGRLWTTHLFMAVAESRPGDAAAPRPAPARAAPAAAAPAPPPATATTPAAPVTTAAPPPTAPPATVPDQPPATPEPSLAPAPPAAPVEEIPVGTVVAPRPAGHGADASGTAAVVVLALVALVALGAGAFGRFGARLRA